MPICPTNCVAIKHQIFSDDRYLNDDLSFGESMEEGIASLISMEDAIKYARSCEIDEEMSD